MFRKLNDTVTKSNLDHLRQRVFKLVEEVESWMPHQTDQHDLYRLLAVREALAAAREYCHANPHGGYIEEKTEAARHALADADAERARQRNAEARAKLERGEPAAFVLEVREE